MASAVPAQETTEPSPPSPTITTTSESGGDWPDPQRVQSRGLLSTKVGHGCLATLPDEIERVALADDSIARAQIISPRELLLTGLRPGETTVHVWLADGRRFRYVFRTELDMDLLERAVADLDPRIRTESSADSATLVLYGEVADREIAQAAGARAGAVASAAGADVQVLNLLRYPGAAFSVEDELQALLADIDPRIRVRRIQVGAQPDVATDTFVLEGHVPTTEQMVRAVVLAERQLGGTGGTVRAADVEQGLNADRFRGSSLSGAGLSSGTGSRFGLLGATEPRSTSLAAQVARGQVITSESGRVISLLEIDHIHQVMVSIRVLEVDRAKARKAGFNFRIDAEDISIGSYTGPAVNSLPGSQPGPTVVPTVDGLTADLGNIVGAFVDQTQAIVTAIDFLEEKDLARSVAEPNVLTLSGELASISVGGEVPIPTTASTSVSTFQGFFFQNFGVRLDIRPTVTDGDMVALEVAPSISRPTGGGLNGVPSFTVQSVTTTARVQAGQSLLIGGLLSFEEGLEERRIPGLGVIPVFRWKRRSRSDRELLFVITPRLVKIDREQIADAVIDPTADPEELGLPEVRWPEERRRWRDAFEPAVMPADGIPTSFRVAPREVLPPPAAPQAAVTGTPVPPEAAPPPETTAPAPAPALATPPRYWVVRARPCLNLRTQPGIWAPPAGCLAEGTRVELLEPAGTWSRVRVTADGSSGWVATAYLGPAPEPEVDPVESPEEGAAAAVAEPDELARRAAEAAAEEARLERELEELKAAVDDVREADDGS